MIEQGLTMPNMAEIAQSGKACASIDLLEASTVEKSVKNGNTVVDHLVFVTVVRRNSPRMTSLAEDP